MTPPNGMPSPRKITLRRIPTPWIAATILLAVAVGFAFFDAGSSHAQGDDNDHVDVALILEFPETVVGGTIHHLNVIVVNHGSRNAYDVEVEVDVVYPEDNSRFQALIVPVQGVSLGSNGRTLRWTIPELGGLQREEFAARVTYKSNSAPTFDNSLHPHEVFGEVTTSSFESDLHKGNNTSRVWSYRYSTLNDSYIQVEGNYSVAVSVDNSSPSPGDTVNFTTTVDRANPISELLSLTALTPPPIDLKVDIALTDGLTVSGAPSYSPTTADGKPASVSYSNGVFNIGTRKMDDPQPPTYSVTLPVSVASNAVVNEQCLTATVTGNPPPGVGPRDDDISDNVAKLCLGTAPEGPLLISQVDVFNIYPCVGNSDSPCDNSDDVRVRAINTTGPVGVILGPGRALLQVRDEPNREYDSSANSVNAGTIVSWPISVTWTAEHFSTVIAQWSYLSDGFAVSGASGGAPPGLVHIRAFEDSPPAIIYKMTPDTSPPWTVEDVGYAPDANTVGPYTYTAEFEKLGTYKLQFIAKLTRATLDGDENCDPNTANPPVNQRFCATETYTFHVGPIAELEVRDGGASPHAAADQHALTIVAINNGPDESSVGARVTGLPTGAEVLHISQGTYDDSNGQWDIGELRVRGYHRSRGGPEPTLVLSASAGDTATVSIANSENYEVCVGPMSNPGNLAHTTQAACEAVTDASWNSTPVYDYNDGNNTATITAQAGTGGVGEGIPTLQTPTVHSPSVRFGWNPIDYIYGVPVKDYDVQSSTNGIGDWTQLETALPFNLLLDITIESGVTRYYRVRAVNQADVKGPWSAPIAAMVERQATAGAPDAPVLTAVPNEPNGRTEILITWTKPVENGSAITAYTMHVADNASGPWADVSPQPGVADVSYVYSDGLTGGTRKYFRMLATNMCDGSDPAIECDSLWSDVVEVTTRAPGISSAPTGVSAVPDGDAAIDVSWSAPADDGGTPITRYEVQWSADGMGGWNSAGSTPDGTTLTLKNTGMTFGTTRYYRVAARNSRGLSAWSDPPYASATTLSGVPGQPSLTVSATDAHTIALTWTAPADNGDPITGYAIEWSADGSVGSWTALDSLGATATSYDDTPLNPGTQRYYRIRAVNSTGQGSWSTARNTTTPPAVPGAPTNVQAAANGENAINLSWEPPFDDGGADISGYELHVSTDNGTNYSRLTNPAASARSYTHGGLQPGDGRHYKVRAHNRAGPGVFSEPAFATTLTGVPAAPSLTAQANGASEIKLSWNKPDDRGSDILAYHLQQSDDGNDWYFLGGSISASDSEYVHTGLSGDTTKHYRIRAVNGNGEGEWSASRSARTDAGGPDAPVLTLTVADDNQIDLSWTVPADNGSSIRGYWVERSAAGDAPWERLSSNTTTTTYSDDTLYRGMTRHYRVAAFNGAGTGPYSEAKSATTTGDPATASEAPKRLRFSAVGRNQVTIAWDPPDDDGGAPVSGYEYEVARPCPPPGTGTCDFTGDDIKATSGTSASITGLSAKGDYYFQVRAVNPVGKGNWSGDIRATLNPSQSGLLQVSPVTVNVNEGATASYTVRLSHAPPHPVEVQITASGPSGANDLMEEVRRYQGHYLVPDGWTHPGGRDWSGFTHNWRQGMRVQFAAPEDGDTVDDVATFGHAVYAASHSHLGLSDADWRQDWYDSTAYSLVECTANCADADPANHSVRSNLLTGAGVKVTVRDND